MNQILLLSHGTMAEGMYRAARMLAGDVSRIEYLCLTEEMDIRQFREKLDAVLSQTDPSETLTVLTDINGGSPYITAIELLMEKGLLANTHVISGMNLPLLVQVMLAYEVPDAQQIQEYIRQAGEGIALFQMTGEQEEEL